MGNRIKEIQCYRAVSKISKPIADATHSIDQIAFNIVEITTEKGVTGQGYLLAFNYSRNAIEGALKDVCEFVENHEYQVYEMPRVRKDWDAEAEYFGNSGINNSAIAALNIAMWDAWGRENGQPVWKMLGACHSRVPVYGSGGWLSYTDEELLDEVLDYKGRGFKAVKIKVGSPEAGRDLERLRLCRDALGPGVSIMMDANQGMDVPSALTLATKAKELNIHWFEEPVVHTDFAGYKMLRDNCGISLAMGEREYDCEALKHLIGINALDMWQPDIVRLGGVESWLASSAVANAYNLPALPHYYKDYDVPLLCTIPNAYGSESFDWIDGIIDNVMRVEDGYAYPRTGPGWGFTFNAESMTEVK